MSSNIDRTRTCVDGVHCLQQCESVRVLFLLCVYQTRGLVFAEKCSPVSADFCQLSCFGGGGRKICTLMPRYGDAPFPRQKLLRYLCETTYLFVRFSGVGGVFGSTQ